MSFIISYTFSLPGIQYSVKKNDIVKYEARNIESVRQLMRQQSAKVNNAYWLHYIVYYVHDKTMRRNSQVTL